MMTMDVRRRISEGGGAVYETTEQTQSKPAAKRSFDVAFLMAPDDTAKRRHQENLKEQLRLVTTSPLLYPNPEENRRQSYSEVGLLMTSPPKEEFPKSAFTKVNRDSLQVPQVPISPGPVSPEYASPDVSPTARSPTYYTKYMSKPFYNEKSSPEEDKGTSAKRYPEVVPYGGLAMAYPFPGGFPTAPPLLAAANVTAALLPSSLAALTLPAQNVCAKCNISFRMTSDLVYHMRSQHKSDHTSVDNSHRRREQDKLRCPVCNESFRERHHLTRHMTAHQDKEGDRDGEEEENLVRRRSSK